MRKFLFLLGLGLLGGMSSAQAEGPSFDCFKGSLSPTETLICEDVELSRLDRLLSQAYAAAIKKSDAERTKAAQIAWLRQRPRTCQIPTDEGATITLAQKWHAAPCLAEAYQKRLVELGQSDQKKISAPQKEDFIHPLCFFDLIQASEDEKNPKPFPLNDCNRGYRHIEAIDETAEIGTGGTNGEISYSFIGRSIMGDIVFIWLNTGGTGQFTRLWILKRSVEQGQKILTLMPINHPMGDRANGGIEEAKMDSNTRLIIRSRTTPAELIASQMPDANVDALPSCAICVGATMVYRHDLKTGQSRLISADVYEYDTQGAESDGAEGQAIACYMKIAKLHGKVLKTGDEEYYSMNPASVKRFAQQVTQKCLK